MKLLEAALWAFHKTKNFRNCALLAVNFGHAADTMGAVCGQLAGAFYGEHVIPESWRSKLAMRELIETMAEREGFEPSIQALVPYSGLANRRLQPLGHLSITYLQVYVVSDSRTS